MDPLLIQVPETIETQRLILRAPRDDEGPEINRAVSESFAELHQWMPWAAKCPTLAASRLEIRCDENNRRSRRVPERLGFQLKGVHRHDSRSPAGELRNTCDYAMIAADWAAQSAQTKYPN